MNGVIASVRRQGALFVFTKVFGSGLEYFLARVGRKSGFIIIEIFISRSGPTISVKPAESGKEKHPLCPAFVKNESFKQDERVSISPDRQKPNPKNVPGFIYSKTVGL
jgi:hypothetical protein